LFLSFILWRVARHLEERKSKRRVPVIMIRILALTVLTMLAMLTTVPADAQTYGGDGPICLTYYQWGGSRSIDCGYSSMAQCQATASGLSATCGINPNANAREPAHRQHRRGY
jgi:hypothetical protein